MKKRTLGIDIDDVLASHAPAFVAYCNQKWGTHLRVEDYTEHWSELWQVEMDEALVRVDEYYRSGLISQLEQIEDADAVLKELKTRYKLVIITSRHRSLQKDTLEWIEKYYPGMFEEVHFAGIWDGAKDLLKALKLTKAQVARELGVDILIDDQPKHCNAAVEAGVEALLFGGYPWHEVEIVDSRVRRVNSWAEVKDLLLNARK